MTSSPREPVGAEAMEAGDMADLTYRVKVAHAVADALGGCYRHGGAGRMLRIVRRFGLDPVNVERTIHSALHALEDSATAALTAFRASARDDASLERAAALLTVERTAAAFLEQTDEYRIAVEVHGQGSMRAGRAWDVQTRAMRDLRLALDLATKALASSPAARPAKEASVVPSVVTGASGTPRTASADAGSSGTTLAQPTDEDDRLKRRLAHLKEVGPLASPQTNSPPTSPHGDAARPASEDKLRDEFTKAALAYYEADRTYNESNEQSGDYGPLYRAAYEAEKRLDDAYTALRSAAATTREGDAK